MGMDAFVWKLCFRWIAVKSGEVTEGYSGGG